MKTQKETKSEISNPLTKRNIKIAKITLISLAFLLLTASFYTGFNKLAKFLNANEFVKYDMVTVKFHKPFEFVPNEVMAERRAMDKKIEQLTPYFEWRLENPDPIFNYDDVTMSKEEIQERFGMEFYQTVHFYESTNGTNPTAGSLQKYCEDKGLRNQVGYNPQGKQCFKTESEEVATVIDWVNRKCEGMSLSQCLCYYNEGVNKETGKPNTTCYYSEGNLSLAN